ncbi:MAG: P1 family peptidase [Gemmatimonadaceae bacterium]
MQVFRTIALLCCLTSAVSAQQKSRARDLGVPFEGLPGPLNAITDVRGVEVGHATIVRGEGKLVVGVGPVRTGVTGVLPRGRSSKEPVFASWFTLNGNGEMTGTTYLDEDGVLYGPLAITNTLSVGVVRDAVISWVERNHYDAFEAGLPVVAETWDGPFNDISGMHVKAEHLFQALDRASGGAVAEGSVGGGTGMMCHEFKGGIGTASRRLSADAGGYTVGVLVQCNCCSRERLTIDGVPVGREIPDLRSCVTIPDPSSDWAKTLPKCSATGSRAPVKPPKGRNGSIIVIVATDAPLISSQLRRVAKRVALGVGRTGGLGEDSSGDIFLAFSTISTGLLSDSAVTSVRMLRNERINPIFAATVQATEEAIVNAMVAAETTTGADGLRLFALPHDRLVAAMRKYGR